MKTIKKMLYRILTIIVVLSGMFLNSCEPTYCAWCYERGTIHVDREIEICADDKEELLILIDEAEAMGYDCELKDSK